MFVVPTQTRLEREPAAIGHGVSGVENQIEKDLLEVVTHQRNRRQDLCDTAF